MPYYPHPQLSHSAYGRSTSPYDPHSSADAAIRLVNDYPAYDDSYGGDEAGQGEFVNSRGGGRPPSFRSHQQGGQQSGEGVYLGGDEEGYESEISPATAPLQPHRHYSAYPSSAAAQTPYEPDLDLHLPSPAPLYSAGGNTGGRYDDYEEDVKDSGEFEESFEAGRGGDDNEDEGEDRGQGFDSPLSFQGGFGAPPAVRPIFPCSLPSLFLPRRNEQLAYPLLALADRPCPSKAEPSRQAHRGKPRDPLYDPDAAARFLAEEGWGRVYADSVRPSLPLHSYDAG